MKGTRAIKDSLLLTDYSQRGFLDRWQFEDALNYAGAFTTGDVFLFCFIIIIIANISIYVSL